MVKLNFIIVAISIYLPNASCFISSLPSRSNRFMLTFNKLNNIRNDIESSAGFSSMQNSFNCNCNIAEMTRSILTFGILTVPSSAFAVDGKFGLLEGMWAGMIHPVSMLLLYALSFFAAFHGIQYRRTREIATSIKAAQSAAIVDASTVLRLQEERSKLLSGGHRDKHVYAGSIILGTGIALALEGGLSTWWRVGELFPSEHLFVGIGMSAIWALSSSLTPWMAKGNDSARRAHIALNILGILLFTWQISTGWEGMVNVWNRVPGW